LKEFIAYAKANPGKVNLGARASARRRTGGRELRVRAGIDLTHVPYKGEGPAMTDLMGGQIQVVTPNLGAAIGLIQQGKIRALASPARSEARSSPKSPPWRKRCRDSRTPVGSGSWRLRGRRAR
jgi:tripartite-type tricarboxylate transporter receptor subunit TctC